MSEAFVWFVLITYSVITVCMGIFVVYAIRNGIYPESLIRTIEPEESQQPAPTEEQ